MKLFLALMLLPLCSCTMLVNRDGAFASVGDRTGNRQVSIVRGTLEESAVDRATAVEAIAKVPVYLRAWDTAESVIGETGSVIRNVTD